MIVTLQTQGLQSLEQVRAFLQGSQSLGFEVPNREATYEFIAQTLRHFAYTRLGKADKGLLPPPVLVVRPAEQRARCGQHTPVSW